MASGVLEVSEETTPVPAVTPSSRVMVEQLTPRVSRTSVSPAVFRPACEEAAPIVRLGSLVGSHHPDCEFADPRSLESLCTPRHSCRPMCTCLSKDDLDIAFAVELHERDLVIDAYYVARSLLAKKQYLLVDNADLNHIIYKFECVLHLYRLLAVLDVSGSTIFLRNLLADDVHKTTVMWSDEGSYNSGDPLLTAIAMLTPRKASHKRVRMSGRDFSRVKLIWPLDRRSSSVTTVENDGLMVVGASPSHAIEALIRNAKKQHPLSVGKKANNKKGGPKKKLIKPLDTLKDVGIIALPGAFDVPLIDYLTECCLQPTFPNAPLAQMASGAGKTAIPASLDPLRWVCLVNDALECRIWLHHVPDSTAILLRLEGMVYSPLVDILSVMAEVEHARKWVPYMTSPVRMGLAECRCVCRSGRFDKTTSYLFALPWPLKDRLATIQGWLVDDIQRNGSFTFSYRAFTPDSNSDFSPLQKPLVVPPGSVPVEFEGGAVLTSVTPNNSFVRMVSLIDPKEKLPAVVINFFAARFMKMAWNAFRKVCVNAGTNEVLRAARSSDPWLYEYIQERQDSLNSR